MIQLALGILVLAGYVVFDKVYPSPGKKKAPKFVMKDNIVYKDNVIYHSPKTFVNGKRLCYKFKCRINPDKARLADGRFVNMQVPEEYIIRTFTVGVTPTDNSVNFVYLGPEQYHCDNDPVSECLCLQHLYMETLSYDFLEKLLDLTMIYDVEDPMRADHWDNNEYKKLNRDVLKAIAC